MFIDEVRIDWQKISKDSYLQNIEAIKEVKNISFTNPLTFFVGENGSGKSTLLEAIAIKKGFNPEGGTKNYSFSTYDSHSDLYQGITIVKNSKEKWGFFLRAESFYNVATKEDEYGKESKGEPLHLHQKSHGESFLATLQQNFQADSLYIFDEPEAALSMQRQLTLLIEINRCIKNGCQFIIATHSPILLGMPDATIFDFNHGSIHSISYEETDSFQITSMFIRQREQLLSKLLDE